MKIRNSVRTAVVGTATTVMLVGGTALPAHAGTNEYIDVAGGRVSFTAYGEWLRATDSRKDGYCMSAILNVGKDSHGHVIEYKADACGYGTIDRENLSLPEGKTVKLKACYTTHGGGRIVQCSDWQYATA